MVFFGLFDKNEAPPKECFIAIHCRRLDTSPPYDCLAQYSSNVKKYGHWALQIGSLFYEILEPQSAVALRLLDSLDIETLKQIACTLDDQSSRIEIASEDDRNIVQSYIMKRLQREAQPEDSLTVLDREDDPFILCPSRPGKGQSGEAGDEALAPLVISKGRAWSMLPKSDHEILPMRSLRITSRQAVGEARQMYKDVFRWGYDASAYNSHAFALYLLFPMKLWNERLQYDRSLYQTMWENSKQRLFKDPSMDFPYVGASLIIYRMWRDIIGEPIPDFKVKWEQDSGPAGRNWIFDWKEIKYKRVVPPVLMRESFEGRPYHSDAKLDVQIDPRSHAAHAIKQIHHDLMQNRPKTLNDAVMRQLRTEHG